MAKIAARVARSSLDIAPPHVALGLVPRCDRAPLMSVEELDCLISGRDKAGSLDVRRGIERKEFFLAYQPQFEIDSFGQALSGVEALLRWRHPRLGVLRPSRFMPAVELADLGDKLAAYVLETAIEQVRTWLDTAGWSPRVAINVATQQLDSSSLCERILHALETCGVEPQYLKVEILESPVIRDAALTARELRLLREGGVAVAIDDFGTGSASFHYLLQFPFDSIKICAEFVQGIGQGTGADEICQAIIQLGRSLGKQVIAEGVETEQQLDFLRRHHCHEVQGFLLGRPVEGESFVDLFMGGLAGALPF